MAIRNEQSRSDKCNAHGIGSWQMKQPIICNEFTITRVSASVKVIQQLYERIVRLQPSVAFMRSPNLRDGEHLTIVEKIKSGKSQSIRIAYLNNVQNGFN